MGLQTHPPIQCDLSELSAWQRVLVTANGNLQVILSSAYNHPVHVLVLENKELKKREWHRIVQLLIRGRLLCTATTQAIVVSTRAHLLIDSGAVGIGQLFRYSILF